MAFDIILVISYAVVFTFVNASCPRMCRCSGIEISCSNVFMTAKDLQEMKLSSSITQARLINNNMKEISADLLQNLVNLTSLEISHNSIKTIPGNTFQNFDNLRTLILRRNSIRILNKDSFRGLTKLSKLDIGDNDLVHLVPRVFHDLASLVEIKLINNKIDMIPNDVFTHHAMLQDVFLTNNKISRLGNKSFQNLTIKRMSLMHNKLKRVPSSAFQGTKVSFKIVMFFNPLECLCRDLVDYHARLKHLKHKILGMCDSPSELKDKNILSAYAESKCTLCDSHPCLNGGRCAGNKTRYTCGCKDKFKGRNCETSICKKEIKIVERIIHVPAKKTIVSFFDKLQGNDTEKRPTVSHADMANMEKKIVILYAMCSVEFLVILCFVALFMWKRYQDWKLLKEYDHQKRKQVLDKIRYTTNRKLQETIY